MIPLKDDNPTNNFPLMTVIIIAINCAVYLYQVTLPEMYSQAFVFKYGFIPMELTRMADMTPEVPFPFWLSPFTSMFLHGGFMHLAGNMLYLWIFGNNVEDFLGRGKFVLFYIVSGLAAVALYTLFDRNGTVPLIGASGAIAGVMGAYIVLWPKARILTLIWIIFIIRLLWLPAVIILGFWIALQVFMGLSSIGASQQGGVAYFAHVGGFAFGWLLMRLRRKKRLSADSISGNDEYYRWH